VQQKKFYGPVAQLVRAPPCHGGSRRSESDPGRFKGKTETAVPFYAAGFFCFRKPKLTKYPD
jgi:hypothetical protein